MNERQTIRKICEELNVSPETLVKTIERFKKEIEEMKNDIR